MSKPTLQVSAGGAAPARKAMRLSTPRTGPMLSHTAANVDVTDDLTEAAAWAAQVAESRDSLLARLAKKVQSSGLDEMRTQLAALREHEERTVAKRGRAPRIAKRRKWLEFCVAQQEKSAAEFLARNPLEAPASPRGVYSRLSDQGGRAGILDVHDATGRRVAHIIALHDVETWGAALQAAWHLVHCLPEAAPEGRHLAVVR